MGIYDRDYYRNEGPSFLGSITSTSSVCKWLIIINVAVFIIQMLDFRGVFGPRGGFTRAFDLTTGAAVRLAPEQLRGLDPDEAREVLRAHDAEATRPGVLQGQVWRLLTYAFLHSPLAFFHIFWNMLFLWWFGSDVEELYGSREFLTFYLVSALAGGVAYVVAQVSGIVGSGAALGASGAVTAVMVLAALHFPTRVIMLFFVIPVPIWLIVVYQVGKDFWEFLGGFDTGTAVAVHLGGAAFAFAYFQLQLRLLSFVPNFRAWRVRRNRPRLRVYREEEPVAAPAPRAAAPDRDEQLEAKVDAILAKVARKENLTDKEQQILQRASEVYKKRRS
jgi:membrane associated rhomboid family serine protease